jgi:hypothetical protein
LLLKTSGSVTSQVFIKFWIKNCFICID